MNLRINKKLKLKNSNELIGEEKNQNNNKDKSSKNSNSLNEVRI